MAKNAAHSSADNPFAAHHWVFEEGAQDARRQVQFASPSCKRPAPAPTPVKAHTTAPSAAVRRARACFQWHTLLGLSALVVLLLAILTDMQVSSLVPYLRSEAFPRFPPEFPFRFRLVNDAIPSNVIRYVDASINRALISQVGRRDYALALDGAHISPSLTSPSFGGESSHGGSKSGCYVHPAEVVLRDNMHGGRCWLLPAPQGQLGIFMLDVIYPTHITIDHVPMELARHIDADIQQAPRSVRVWGVIEGRQNEERYALYREDHPELDSLPHGGPPLTSDQKFVSIAEFQYDIYASQYSQTFPVHEYVRNARLAVAVYVFEILDNWGAETTCIYRVRVHGKETAD